MTYDHFPKAVGSRKPKFTLTLSFYTSNNIIITFSFYYANNIPTQDVLDLYLVI